mmetsp:Transcript_28776/g.63366  ORF Transcript_28776/g.63366 Transcript_28776/m.63366 type:complete len:298 (-) Transcript_28776:241-1134(-)
MVGKQCRHLVQNVLDASLLLLVRVKDFQELLVSLGLGREALLDGGNVVDGVIEFDRLPSPSSSATTLLLLLLLLLNRRAHLLLHVRWRTTTRLRSTGRTERWTPRRSLAARLTGPLPLLLISRWHTPRRTARRSPLLPTPHVRGHGARRSAGGRSPLRRRRRRRRTARSRTAHATLPRSKDVRNARLAGTAINGKDLTGLVRRELDLVPLGEERVETEDEIVVPAEQRRNAADNAGGVNLLSLEVLHDIQELVVDARAVAELELHLIEVEEGVLHLELAHLRLRGRSPSAAAGNRGG